MNYVEAMENTYFEFKAKEVEKDIARLNEKISAARNAISEINRDKIHIDYTDKRYLLKEEKEDYKQAAIDANYFMKRLESAIKDAEFEITQTLDNLSVSAEPRERLIALQNGFGDEKFFNDTDPLIKKELIKRNLDNEDILMRFVNDDDADVKKAILDTKNETVLSILSNDETDSIRETAELLLKRIEAINELSDFDKLMLIAESQGWVTHISEGEYQDTIDFSQYSPADQDFSFTIIMRDSYSGEEIDAEDYPSKLVSEVQDYYENYDPDEEAQLWTDDTGHGTNGAPYEYEDLLADMKACETMVKDLSDALYDAYYNNNYIKHIDLTQVDIDDIKSSAAKEDKGEPSKAKRQLKEINIE